MLTGAEGRRALHCTCIWKEVLFMLFTYGPPEPPHQPHPPPRAGTAAAGHAACGGRAGAHEKTSQNGIIVSTHLISGFPLDAVKSPAHAS